MVATQMPLVHAAHPGCHSRSCRKNLRRDVTGSDVCSRMWARDRSIHTNAVHNACLLRVLSCTLEVLGEVAFTWLAT